MKTGAAALLDSRRLTGPNLFCRSAGAVCDLSVDADYIPKVLESWQRHARSLLISVRWIDEKTYHRAHADGVTVMLTAPIDALYAATELNELAVAYCLAELRGQPLRPGEGIDRVRELIESESNPPLLALRDAARAHKVPFLSDDEEVSVGYGRGCQTYPVGLIPEPHDVPWSKTGSIPVALVTGTNGKSTTVRLAANILMADGKKVGATSTDHIQIDDWVMEKGDFSGPGGARKLLRHPDPEVALLEVARGGMLRRGLGVTRADTALITNVAADHLGEYGIHTVAEMTETKFIVRRALERGRSLILNADDENIQRFARTLHAQRIVWFSEDANHPIIHGHCMAGGDAVVVDDGHITFVEREREAVVKVAEIPVTLGGKARYNVQNALAAAALCHVLGASNEAIAKGLTSFIPSPERNPGRGNLFSGNGIRALVDFAHNEHGLAAVATTVSQIKAKRRLVMLGQAGDRSDELIEGLVDAAFLANPDQLVICRLPGYERGRAEDEVPRLMHRLALERGMDESRIMHADSPVNGVRCALNWAETGDLLLLLTLTQRGDCIKVLRETMRG